MTQTPRTPPVEGPRDHERRLDALWRGDFGDAYTARNAQAANGRQAYWSEFLARYPVESVIEVGCNVGANLQCIRTARPEAKLVGVDLNRTALGGMTTAVPTAAPVIGNARALPLVDRGAELVLTMGVLIHQPPHGLGEAMREIARCSARYVLCGEYFSESVQVVPYRGHDGALYKLDFGARYLEECPGLVLRDRGFLPRGTGWDDVTWWLLERA